MFLSPGRPTYLQLVPYSHFAEPFPLGVVITYVDSTATEDELTDAAEAVRTAEIDAVQTGYANDGMPAVNALSSMKLTQTDLESMTIDELRALANGLDIPERATITEKAELIDEILRRS